MSFYSTSTRSAASIQPRSSCSHFSYKVKMKVALMDSGGSSGWLGVLRHLTVQCCANLVRDSMPRAYEALIFRFCSDTFLVCVMIITQMP